MERAGGDRTKGAVSQAAEGPLAGGPRLPPLPLWRGPHFLGNLELQRDRARGGWIQPEGFRTELRVCLQ